MEHVNTKDASPLYFYRIIFKAYCSISFLEMTRKKRAESWRERRRRASIRYQRAIEAERARIDKRLKKRNVPRWKILALILSLACVVGAFAVWQWMQSTSTSETRRFKAPQFTLMDIDGNRVSLKDFVGKVVVLVFFDTYCPPCISELSYLKRLHKRAGDEIVILSVDVDPIHDTVEVLRRFREENRISWPILIGTSKVINTYEIQYTPTTLLIDRNGFIYKGYIGWSVRSSPSRLDEDINHLLEGGG